MTVRPRQWFLVLVVSYFLPNPHPMLSRSRYQLSTSAPYIEVFWDDEPNAYHYTLTGNHLEEWAIFGRYNDAVLKSHELPQEITYRNHPENAVARSTLEETLEHFIGELLATRRRVKKDFDDVIVLKDRDFNYTKSSGIIIVKLKKYPFVVKIFRETPATFVLPFSKGIEPGFFFIMGNGINRYLAGFTRISNLESINEAITQNPEWAQTVTTPRKWYWVPHNGRSFTIIGHNVGPKPLQKITYPSLYAIICDEIVKEREFSLTIAQDREWAMNFTGALSNRLDPNICNFMIEKETKKIAIIDTEHFASITGLKEKVVFKDYVSWYGKLAYKCVRSAMFTTPQERLRERLAPTPENLVV